jgi:hypothetical protein
MAAEGLWCAGSTWGCHPLHLHPPPIMVTLEVGSVWGSWDCCSGDEGSEAHIHVQDTLTSVRKSTGGAIEQPKK